MDQLMRCSKVAAKFDISVRTLKRRVKAGKFPLMPVDGWYFKRSDVDRELALMNYDRAVRIERAMGRAPKPERNFTPNQAASK